MVDRVKRVVVPSSVVSHILGSNGSKLEAICRVTRAHIELEKTTNPGEMTFVLRSVHFHQMQNNCSRGEVKVACLAVTYLLYEGREGRLASAMHSLTALHCSQHISVLRHLGGALCKFNE